MGTGILDPETPPLPEELHFLLHPQPLSPPVLSSINSPPLHFDDLGEFLLHDHGDLPPEPYTGGVASSEDTGIPEKDSEDFVLTYISQMLMEDDIDNKSFFDEPDLIAAAEKPFLEILGETSTNSSSSDFSNPDSTNPSFSLTSTSFSNRGSSNLDDGFDGATGKGNFHHWPYDPIEYSQLQTLPIPLGYTGVGEVADPTLQFMKGLEEAQKFLPSIIDLEAASFAVPGQPAIGVDEVVKVEKEEDNVIKPNRGRKNRLSDEAELEDGRSIKLSATEIDEDGTREMFDKLFFNRNMFCNGVRELREAMQREMEKNAANSKGNGKGRGRKQSNGVVDLRTLLIQCAQAVASDDRRSANELLKQIREHSSLTGDANQRLAHFVADGLQARLAGTASELFKSTMSQRISVAEILKAYQLYMSACPFKKLSFMFSNWSILDAAKGATCIHVIDFGIHYGFQWPCFLQRLAEMPGGAPRLRLTGIDMPQSGFRPAERIQDTGRRLADYARLHGLDFEFRAIAAKFETLQIEDMDLRPDEVLVVNCLYQFKSLADETLIMDEPSPRDIVLNTIRKMRPRVFIQGIVNGSSAPFFMTRFRETLFYYSALFDMFECTMPRECDERLTIERNLFGRCGLNIIACEGADRVERPESYKQWQVRNSRAGFTQLPPNPNIMKTVREKKSFYHKDFNVDEDHQWVLLGWKGRIVYALSAWKPDGEDLSAD